MILKLQGSKPIARLRTEMGSNSFLPPSRRIRTYSGANDGQATPKEVHGGLSMRSTETEVTFTQPFHLEALVEPQEAGTYRLVVDEELIEGLSFPAYRRVAAHLEIPPISVATGTRQCLQVSYEEILRALALDATQGREVDGRPATGSDPALTSKKGGHDVFHHTER